jgi:hypothetical protein
MKETLAEMLDRHSFEPFVITTVDGFAIAIDNPHKVLLGLQMLVVADNSDRLYHVPYRSIAHLSEKNVPH